MIIVRVVRWGTKGEAEEVRLGRSTAQDELAGAGKEKWESKPRSEALPPRRSILLLRRWGNMRREDDGGVMEMMMIFKKPNAAAQAMGGEILRTN